MKILTKLAVISCISLAPAMARADTVWIGEPGSNPIKADNVKIQSVDGDTVTYTTESGVNSTKKLAQLQLIKVDGETNFDSAEDAFVAKKWNDALSGYQVVVASSSEKDWIKKRSANRLMLVAKQLNRYDAEVAGYVALVQLDPTAADQVKPSAPAENSPYLDTAASTVSRALGNGQISDQQKTELLGLQVDIFHAQKKTGNADQAMQQLAARGGTSAKDTGMVKLSAANLAFDSKQYAQAISTIEQNKAAFTDPAQQVDALWLLAESKDALAANKTDPETLKDTALAYMRVVTFGSQLGDKPHVPDALLRVGKIEEKLNDPQIAGQMYQLVIKNFGASPAATGARAAAATLAK